MSDLVDRVFEVAYFWKIDPFALLDRSLDDVLELYGQQNRIVEILNRASNGR